MDHGIGKTLARPKLVPWPREITFDGGQLTPGRALWLARGEQGAAAQVAETFAADLAHLGYAPTTLPEGDACPLTLAVESDEALGPEGYRLTVSGEGISLVGATERGLFWGTRTALQLLSGGPGAALPWLRIADEPQVGYRGLLIDTARQFHSLAFHEEMIRVLASYKMNAYQIHFSDDQSYTLPSRAYPQLPTAERSYSIAELRRLAEVAAAYQVTIVPEIDLPGHSKALTSALPELWCDHRNEPPGVVCLGQERSYDILRTLMAETMEWLPGPYWHLGADEVRYREYDGCTCCAAAIAELGLGGIQGLYHRFINRMNAFIKAQGRRTFIWEGFVPGSEPIVDKDIVVFPFDVKFRGRLPADYAREGYALMNASWSPLYIAGQSMTTPEDMALWHPRLFGAGRSPTPPKYWLRLPAEASLLGGQMCCWENEERAERGLLLGVGPGFPEYGRPGPRLQIVAERLWTGNQTTAADLLERVGAAWW